MYATLVRTIIHVVTGLLTVRARTVLTLGLFEASLRAITSCRALPLPMPTLLATAALVLARLLALTSEMPNLSTAVTTLIVTTTPILIPTVTLAIPARRELERLGHSVRWNVPSVRSRSRVRGAVLLVICPVLGYAAVQFLLQRLATDRGHETILSLRRWPNRRGWRRATLTAQFCDVLVELRYRVIAKVCSTYR